MAIRRRATWWSLAAALLGVAIVGAVAWRHASDPAVRLRRVAASLPSRPVSGRLAGFQWNHTAAPARGDSESIDRMRVVGPAVEVIDRKTDQSAEAMHAKGVAYLLVGQRNAAISALQAAAREASDAAIWNDLAVACDELSTRQARPGKLPVALAAVDHALQSSPELTEALFNRALILEHMGLQDRALRAWYRYLETDDSTPWANEARQRIVRLRTVAPPDFPKEARRARAAFDAGDATATAALVRTNPQLARGWGEGPFLAQWADHLLAGDTAAAEKDLAFVRALGRSLAAFSGETLLADTVDAIDRARSDAPRLRNLAQAQKLYDSGRKKYAARLASDAESILRQAAVAFDAAGSPMAQSARYYAANATFDQNRVDAAYDELRSMESRCDRRRHKALCAGIEWELALCATAAGDWGAAVQHADGAAAIFAALHEPANAAALRAIAAYALDFIGQSDEAWTHRMEAFRDYRAANLRERTAAGLLSAALAIARRGDTATALAVLDTAIEELSGSESVTASRAIAERVRLLTSTGDAMRAAAAVRDARQTAERIHDPALREMTEVHIDVAEAMLERRDHAAASVAQLERSAAFLESHGYRPYLPDVFLQLARSRAAMGRKAEAVRDYARGVDELERQRRTVTDPDARSLVLDASQELVSGAVSLLLDLGDPRQALAFADAVRGRTLRDAWDSSARAAGLAPLPRGTALLEYVVLPQSLAIFTVSDGVISVATVPGRPDEHGATAGRYVEALRANADLGTTQSAAAAAYRLLIAPVAAKLAAANELVIVADQELQGVPFAALYDASTGRYLAERFTIRSAPSAAVAAPTDAGAISPALVVGQSGEGATALSAVKEETERIATLYRTGVLSGADATPARFAADAVHCGLIHYSGHAASDRTTTRSALLLAESASAPGALYASDIERWRLPRHPIVVLAGCGTIRGDASHVEGMPSLARAFVSAGARAVVATSWEIDDALSADLFVAIHRHLAAGLTPAASVRAAQLEMLRSADQRLQHPGSWSQIQVFGPI